MPTVLTCKLVKRHEHSSNIKTYKNSSGSNVMSYFHLQEVKVVFRFIVSLPSFSSSRDGCVSKGTSKLLVQPEGLLSG